MKKDDFVKVFMEGLETSSPDYHTVCGHLVAMLHDAREHTRKLKDVIEEMDDIARNNTIEVKCRSCSEEYVPDCELSEIVGSEWYCGKNEWCTP